MRVRAAVLVLVGLSLVACSSSKSRDSSPSTDGPSTAGTGGVPGTGGGTNDAPDTTSTGGITSAPGGGVGAGGGQAAGGATHVGAGDLTGSGGAHAGTTAAGGASAGTGGTTAAGGAHAGTGGARARTGGTTGAGGANAGTGGATSTGGASAEPSAQDLLDKVTACAATATTVKSGFALDKGEALSVSMYKCEGAVYWKADMDVDCDGIQTPPCDTDKTGQPQTSIVDDAPSGDVDPTKLPYFVIPLGSPETTWYKSAGIELGQVGAVIYRGSVRYGIFADEAGGAFIGEASYAMCQLFLGNGTGGVDPCDPNEGGIDPADVTYVTFTGATNRATGNDIYSHDKHTAMGIAAAKAWLGQ
jgi:hypothetical protein